MIIENYGNLMYDIFSIGWSTYTPEDDTSDVKESVK